MDVTDAPAELSLLPQLLGVCGSGAADSRCG